MRKEHKLSQMRLSDNLGFTQGTLSKIEKGLVQITLDKWYLFCRIYNIDANILINGDMNKLFLDKRKYMNAFAEKNDKAWMENFQLVECHIKKNPLGWLDLNKVHPDKDLLLWVRKQRHYKNSLSSDKIELLNSIGFQWKKINYSWAETFNAYKEYLKENPYGHVKHEQIYKGYKIGRWQYQQRIRYRNGELSVIEIEQLNSIDFDWKITNYKKYKIAS